MAKTTVGGIELVISAEATQAKRQIDNLSTSLRNLGTSVNQGGLSALKNGFKGLNTVLSGLSKIDFSPLQSSVGNIKALSSAISKLTTSTSTSKIDAIAQSLMDLTEWINTITFDQSQLNSLERFADAMERIARSTATARTALTTFRAANRMMGTSQTDAQYAQSRRNDAFAAFQSAEFANYNPTAMQPTQSIVELDDSIRDATANIENTSEEASQRVEGDWTMALQHIDLEAKLRVASIQQTMQGVTQQASAFDMFKSKIKSAIKPLNDFFKSIKRIAMYRLIRTALKAITEGLTTGIQNLARYSAAIGETDSTAANSVMSEYASKFLEVKNAIGAAAMPVLAAIQPLIIGVANAFITAANAINMFISALRGGSTFTKATAQTIDYAKSLDTASGSAKKFKDATTGIDELNVINQESGGGGGSSVPNYAGMFTEDIIPKGLIDKLETIKTLALAIAAALAAWKIGSLFTNNLAKLAGLAMAAAGAVLYIKGLIDAWNDGFNMDNILSTFGGVALLIIGIYTAFGTLAGGITALVAGLGVLVVAFKDIYENGANLYNILALLGGLIITGLGISVLTGTFIPLLIAGIIAAVAGLVYLMGESELAITGLEHLVGGFVDFFKSIIEGDLASAGEAISRMMRGIYELGASVINSFETLYIKFLDWLDGITHGKLAPIFTTMKNMVSGLADSVKQILQGMTEFVAGVFTLDWERAWNGIVEITQGIANRIVTIFEGILNIIVDGINALIDKVNDFASEGLDLGISIPHIPRITLGRDTTETSSTSNGYGGGGGTRHFANGGYPTQGQLFIANEAGAEMVGSIDGHTAVANNEDIVNAVSSGVYAAVTNAMSNTSKNGVQNINVFLDGKQIEASVRNTQQRRGANIASGGIYNYA